MTVLVDARERAQREAAILTKCNEVIALAQKLYNVDLSKMPILFDLKGRAAGMASAQRSWAGVALNVQVRFNRVMIAGDGYEHIVNDTVPHEIAHIVCFMRPELGRNHDQGWRRVCIALGGDGSRCHNEEVVFARGDTYEYIATSGTKVRFSAQRHRKIQNGGVFTLRRCKGRITRECSYSKVGVSGIPVAAKPVAAKVPAPVSAPVTSAVTTPVVPVAPTERAAVKVAGNEPRTFRVRVWLREQHALGKSREYCAEMCGAVFGMSRAQGRSYVLTQWVRAMSSQD